MVSNITDPKVFEDKRGEADFQNVFSQVAQMEWHTLIDPYRYVYTQGYEAGKARERERLGSPTTETITSPSDALVRETAGAIKENSNGVTSSD